MSAGMWCFEAADPEVGFLSDTITHACEANMAGDAEPAEALDVALHRVTRTLPDGRREQAVAETQTLRCPVCGATTAMVEHWPLWMFEEQPGGDE